MTTTIPIVSGDAVTIDHWQGTYRVTAVDDDVHRVTIAGPALVGSVPASHAHVIPGQDEAPKDRP
jgi:hypothetical protein